MIGRRGLRAVCSAFAVLLGGALAACTDVHRDAGDPDADRAAGEESPSAGDAEATPQAPPANAATGRGALALADEASSPANNPTSAARVELGRLLFWDPILSGNRDVACATCHDPAHAYADGRPLSIGVGGVRTKRNALTVLDAAFNGLTLTVPQPDPLSAPMFWDRRAQSLEAQARGPILDRDEMRGPTFDESQIFPEIVTRLASNEDYAARFAATYGAVTEASIVQAIAAFERSLIDHDSSYDRWARGDASALTAAQKRGLAVFEAGGCARCHSGPMFSDFQLHRLGVPDLPGAPHDPGVSGAFRTPSLRNVTRTAPYLHDGVFGTLDQVFQLYARVDRRLDPLLAGVRAPAPDEAADVKAFLASLSDGTFDATVPGTVPSGLVPGGHAFAAAP